MNKKKLKELAVYAGLFLIWIYPVFLGAVEIKDIICSIAFILSVSLLYLIRNRTAAIAAAVLICAATFFIKSINLPSIVAALFLCIAHKICTDEMTVKKSKGKPTGTGSLFVTGGFMAALVQIIIIFVKSDATLQFNFTSSVKGSLWFFIFFIGLFAYTFSKKAQKEVKISGESKNCLRSIYSVAVFAVAASLYKYFIYYGFYNYQQIRADLSCWFVFILFMMFNRDPIAELLLKNAKEKIVSFGVDKKKKADSQN